MWHKGFLSSIALFLSSCAFSHVFAEKLIYGWIPDAPYEYIPPVTSDQRDVKLTGLDIELIRFLGKQMGVSIEFKEIQRKKALTLLQEGHIDFIGGKTQLPSNTQGLALTAPYRTQEDAFFTRKDDPLKETFKTIPELLAFLRTTQMRIAYVKDYQYADARITHFLEEKAKTNPKQFIGVISEEAGMTQLVEKEVQAFIVDRLSGMTIAWERGEADQIVSHGVDFQQHIHFMVSTKWVTPRLLQKMNQGIEAFKKTDIYSNLLALYLYPLIIQKALDTWWFITLQYIGVISLGLAALQVALFERTTLLGTIIYCLLPGFTSLILRDLIMGIHPISVVKSPYYLISVVAFILSISALLRFWPRLYSFYLRYYRHITKICIGAGISTFAINGTMIALVTRSTPVWIWGPFFAMLTSVGGLVIQDMISLRKNKFIFGRDFLPEIPLIWGLILSVVLLWQSHYALIDEVAYSILGATLGAFITFVLFSYYKVTPILFLSQKFLQSMNKNNVVS